MRNFSSKTKGNSRHSFDTSAARRALVILPITLLVLYALGSVLRPIVSAVTHPIYIARTYFAESEAALPTYIRGRNELLNTIEELQNKIVLQSGVDAVLSKLEAENEELRSLLNISVSDRIAAGVIARPPMLPYDVLMLDRGTEEGIKEGATVYLSNDVAIGYVSSAFKDSSLVRLFSSPDVRTTVYVYGPNVFTHAYGEGGGVVRVSIPQGVPLHEGDVVVLPSLTSGLLGTVRTVESIPTEPEQNGFIVLPISLQSIHTVVVDSEYTQPISFEEAERQVRESITNPFNLDLPTEDTSTTSEEAWDSENNTTTPQD